MIVGDSKVIAKTLSISLTVQGFPDIVVSPLCVIVNGNGML
jgi:hypothetical protein